MKSQVGFPIRTSRDRRVLSPPPGLSQSATSFIASCCQGIHQTPLSRLIRSRRRRALLLDGGSNRQPIPKPWTRSLRPGTDPRQEDRPVQQARNAPKGRPSSRSVSFDLERLLFSPRASRPSAGARPTWRTPNSVSCFALFTMSDSASPRSRDRTGRLTQVSLPIGSGFSSGLSLRCLRPRRDWWVGEELNLRPHAYQACALTT
jgi:hypothetical protein